MHDRDEQGTAGESQNAVRKREIIIPGFHPDFPI
jgi:hypothetical protein